MNFFKVKYLYEVCCNDDDLKDFLVDKGLLRDDLRCPVCREKMKLSYQRGLKRYAFRCKTAATSSFPAHDQYISGFKGTCFRERNFQ